MRAYECSTELTDQGKPDGILQFASLVCIGQKEMPKDLVRTVVAITFRE